MSDWKWFQVEFHLGVSAEVEIPTDALEFLEWLFEEPDKYVDGLTVQPAELRTAPF